jgi:type II secretion system protein C
LIQSRLAPRLATALLALALAGNCAFEAMALIHLIGSRRASSPKSVNRPPPLSVDIQAITAAHLFGAAPVRVSPRTSVEEKALVLTGTLATGDPLVGCAVIGTTRDHTRLYAVGEEVLGLGMLRQVYADHVVIERGSERLVVNLPRAKDLLSKLAVKNPAGTDGESQSDPNRHADSPEQIESTLKAESDRLASLFSERPYFLGDKLNGVQIEPGSSAELLTQLGLQPGDILRYVDGALITPDRLDWVRTRLASGSPVRVAGVRPGKGPFDITVDSSTIAGMIQR